MKLNFNLHKKVIVITGGNGLLGREFVSAVSEAGATAVVADVNNYNNLNFSNDRIDYVDMDITSEEAIVKSINYLNNKYKRIDAVVNNAYPRNKNYGKEFFEVDYESFCENVSWHLGGYFLISKSFAKYFCQQGYGNIINMASIYGVIPPKFEIYEGTTMTTPVEYAVIKSAIIHLTKYMAKYFKGKNLRVNSISPGGILNGQDASFLSAYKKNCLNKGMLNPDDIKDTLLFLLSENSNCINGQNIIVDDGFTL